MSQSKMSQPYLTSSQSCSIKTRLKSFVFPHLHTASYEMRNVECDFASISFTLAAMMVSISRTGILRGDLIGNKFDRNTLASHSHDRKPRDSSLSVISALDEFSQFC